MRLNSHLSKEKKLEEEMKLRKDTRKELETE